MDEPWVAIADRVAHAFAAKTDFLVDPDDATQAARVGAWKAWHQWRPDGGMAQETFVGAKAFYAIVDMLRRAGGYGSEVGRWAYAEGARTHLVELRPNASVVGSHAAGVETACDLERALNRIPPREAAVVTLVDLDGFSQEDVAAVLGVSSSRVSQIRTSGLNHLRPLLAA